MPNAIVKMTDASPPPRKQACSPQVKRAVKPSAQVQAAASTRRMLVEDAFHAQRRQKISGARRSVAVRYALF